MSDNEALAPIRAFFAARGFVPHPFQEGTWAAQIEGRSGLVNVPTGSGKTYAAYGGALGLAARHAGSPRRLRVLYLTPLRALANDITAALQAPVEELKLDLKVESRTGDTSSSIKTRQRAKPPDVLVTTPESLALLLSYAGAAKMFGALECVIVDEWHALCADKRGALLQLSLARAKRHAPQAIIWALSATVADLGAAAEAACGVGSDPLLVRSTIERPIELDALTTGVFGTLPWGGENALRIVRAVAEAIDEGPESVMIFANTRSMAEFWYQALLDERPDWAGVMGLHHGSIERDERTWVESALKDGRLRVVVATSSLDLGVDFDPVGRVFQIGSPKSIARLVQRAGRASHRPGAPCRVTCVPTRPSDLLEVDALARALAAGDVEQAPVPDAPADVLTQHMVTCALGGGFDPDELFDEVRGCASYLALDRAAFDEALGLAETGGETLRAYPEYRKVERDEEGRVIVSDKKVARRHRMAIGTISSSSSVQVRFSKGKRLGAIDEGYISRLKAGDQFLFAGRALEFVRLYDMTCFVKLAKGTPRSTPSWQGRRFPLSAPLAARLRESIGAFERGELTPELERARRFLEVQRGLSALPQEHQLLVEIWKDRQGHHLFVYPFEGRLVHEGMASIAALRLGRAAPSTFALSASEYGFGLSSTRAYPFDEALEGGALWETEGLEADAIEATNSSEIARRRFRDVARVAGLVFGGYPGSRKTNRQLQTSTGLLFDVFARYDPDHLLMRQARREVLDDQLERERMQDAMRRMRAAELLVARPRRPTPLGYALAFARQRELISSETLADRLERMKQAWMEVA